jgi:hypothetical protein
MSFFYPSPCILHNHKAAFTLLDSLFAEVAVFSDTAIRDKAYRFLAAYLLLWVRRKHTSRDISPDCTSSPSLS